MGVTTVLGLALAEVTVVRSHPLAFAELHSSLPGFLSGLENWMKASEESLKKLTDAFLLMNTGFPRGQNYGGNTSMGL